MNILFLTILDIVDLHGSGIYEDLLREFKRNGHNVFVASPTEKRFGKKTYVIEDDIATVIKVRTGNFHNTNVINKGISTIRLENQFINALKKHLKDVKIDIILYSTPPITLVKTIKYFKRRDNAFSYLMLKDIFPQNAVDLGMLSKKGLKGIAYRYFRKKEKALYSISDKIGCMSEANRDYLLNHNGEVDKSTVEICPNSICVKDESVNNIQKAEIRKQYGLPQDKTIYIYGGNLGKPQCVPFILECVKECAKFENAFFLLAGAGTDDNVIKEFISKENPTNIKYLGNLKKTEYEKVMSCCDIGLVFLDYRFTIPNFPSRLLSYMQAKLPVLACTDKNTDIGRIIVQNNFGWWVESRCAQDFAEVVKRIESKEENTERMKNNEFDFLLKEYDVKKTYKIIMNSADKVKQ